jgi:predicted nuclease of predicted toxin-antitoxin system
VKFLVDHQLPPALARFIATQGHQAEHVRDLGLMEADDTVIWKHASARDLVIVSKDEDFTFLAGVPGGTGKLVWVRIGNCRKQVLLEAFRIQLPRMVSELEAGGQIVELR